MLHGQVLQRAFTALVADGTIERVRSEQELNDSLLPFPGLLGLSQHDHALGHGICAGRFELWHELHLRLAVFIQYGLAAAAVDHRAADFHQAHPAHASRFHLGMVAEDGDVDTCLLGRVNDQGSGRNADLYTVNG